jgi:signal transduction histidine kinase
LRALHLRLTISLALVLAISAFGLMALLSQTSNRYSDEIRQRLDAGIAMYVVRELPLMSGGKVNHDALRELANRAMTLNPSAEVYLLDRHGVIISSVVQHDQLKRHGVRLHPIEQFLSAPEQRPLYGDDPTSRDGERVFSVAPIADHDRITAYLYVVLGGQPERSIAARLRGSYALRAAAMALGLVLLTALIAGAGLFAALTRRLRALDKSVDDWSRRLPGAAASVAGGDEISTLTMRFQEMIQAIERQFHELKIADDMRRELIANVSHDLRTPLASLRGYIETLLIKGAGSAEQLRAHLSVALRQADQLKRLIDSLFELAKLESGAVAPRIEAFAIAELLQDIGMRFRVRAEQRGVDLRTLIDTGGVTVLADLELIERALSNLLENAIRHTPRNCQVRIEMLVEAVLVRIRVIDNGPGIEPEHLPRIFDRYYRGGGPADRNHAGLGLAIVKKIMDLHSQTVTLESREGVGTSVEITLQRPGQVGITRLARIA